MAEDYQDDTKNHEQQSTKAFKPMRTKFESGRSEQIACSLLLLQSWCLCHTRGAFVTAYTVGAMLLSAYAGKATTYVATTQNGNNIVHTAYAQDWTYAAKVSDVRVTIPGPAGFSVSSITFNPPNQPAIPGGLVQYGPNMEFNDFDQHIEFYGNCSWMDPWLVGVRLHGIESWEWVEDYDLQGNITFSEKRLGMNSLMDPTCPFIVYPFPMMGETHAQVTFQAVNQRSTGYGKGAMHHFSSFPAGWSVSYDADSNETTSSGQRANGVPLTRITEMPHMTLQLDMSGNVVTFNLAPLPGVGLGNMFLDVNGNDPIPLTTTGADSTFWVEDWGNGAEVFQNDSNTWTSTVNWGGTGTRPVQWSGTHADTLNAMGAGAGRNALPNYPTSPPPGSHQIGWLVTYSVDKVACPPPAAFDPDLSFGDYFAYVYTLGVSLGAELQRVPIYSE